MNEHQEPFCNDFRSRVTAGSFKYFEQELIENVKKQLATQHLKGSVIHSTHSYT
jgi:hypothetical protein